MKATATASAAGRRAERINLRLSPEAKRTIERAAAYDAKTLTDFVVDVALDRANEVVRAYERISLTASEWAEFEKLLLDPPKPNARLRRALADHARIVRE